jgi:hypothetical protein
MKQNMENIAERFHLVPDEVYSFSVEQGENCLRSYSSALDAVTNKLFWLCAVQLSVLAAYFGYIFSEIGNPGEMEKKAQLSIFLGALAILPMIVSTIKCVFALRLVRFPINGAIPSDILFEEYLSEEQSQYHFKASAFRRASDLSMSIQSARAAVRDKSKTFTDALTWATVSVAVASLMAIIGLFPLIGWAT